MFQSLSFTERIFIKDSQCRLKSYTLWSFAVLTVLSILFFGYEDRGVRMKAKLVIIIILYIG